MSLVIVSKFGHPSKIKTKKALLSAIEKCSLGRVSKEDVANRVIEYSKNHNSGCNLSSYNVEETIEMANRVKKEIGRLEKMIEKMLEKGREMPEFKLLKSIPNVADKSAIRLLSEIGDIIKDLIILRVSLLILDLIQLLTNQEKMMENISK